MIKLVIVVAIIIVFSSIFSFAPVQDFLISVGSTLVEVVPLFAVPIKFIGDTFNYLSSLTYIYRFIGFILFSFFFKKSLETFGAFSIKKGVINCEKN